MAQAQFGGPTPRRSSRLASVMQSAAGQSAATTTATPSRRKGPLPKAKARHSNAYGATSRLGHAEDMAVPVTGFAQAFESQRGNAVARDEERDESVNNDDRNSHVSGHGSRSVSGISSVHSRDPDQSSVHSERAGSPSQSINNDTSKSYGALRESGMASDLPARTRVGGYVVPKRVRQPVQVVDQEPADEAGNGNDQNWLAFLGMLLLKWWHAFWSFVDEHATDFLRPFLWLVFGIATVMIVSTASTAFTASTHANDATGVGMLGAVSSRIAYQWNGLIHWVQPPTPTSTPTPSPSPDRYNIDDGYMPGYPDKEYDIMSVRLRRIEKRFKDVEDDVQSSMLRLEDLLPPTLLVVRNKDGELEIPDEFWRAISSKMQSGRLSDPSSTTFDVDWDQFNEKTRLKLEQIAEREAEKGIAKRTLEVVSRKEFVDVIERQYMSFSDRIDEKIAEATKALTQELRATAKQEAHQVVLGQLRLDILALESLLANAAMNLNKVNFFSPGLGALVDPFATSSTIKPSKGFLPTLYRKLFTVNDRRPPIAALEPWTEPGDCWCAAPDNAKSGRAQLTVSLAQKIIPRQVTIEHFPKKGLPKREKSSAPKDVELWVESRYLEKVAYIMPQCDAGPKGWSCLGKFTYNINGPNHIQTFNLDVDIHNDDWIPVSKAMVRVTSNWGAEHTCLYRVRLHGDEL